VRWLLALVSALLAWGGPSAVAGLVVPVHVDPVDRVERARLAPHVGQEGNIGGAPARAYLNPAPTVEVPVFVARAFLASGDHVRPAVVLGTAGAALPFAVGRIVGPGLLAPEAATGSGGARTQIAARSDETSAAIASAQPSDAERSARGPRGRRTGHDEESSKPLSGELEWTHGATLGHHPAVLGPNYSMEVRCGAS